MLATGFTALWGNSRWNESFLANVNLLWQRPCHQVSGVCSPNKYPSKPHPPLTNPTSLPWHRDLRHAEKQPGTSRWWEVTQGHTQNDAALLVLEQSLLPGQGSKATPKCGQQTLGFPPTALFGWGRGRVDRSGPTFDRGVRSIFKNDKTRKLELIK